jgi:hypothetical protein
MMIKRWKELELKEKVTRAVGLLALIFLAFILFIGIALFSGGKNKEAGVVFDIPPLLGKSAREVTEILNQTHKTTDVLTEGESGTIDWMDDEHKLLFGFDYNKEGDVTDGILFLTGTREDGHTENSVLKAGNLDRYASEYEIKINPLGEKEVVVIWVSPSSKLDASAKIACRDFNRAIKDAKDGILTNEEFRAKVQKVYDNAKLSSDNEIKGSARDLLAAATSGTTDDAVDATLALTKACNK